MKYELRCRPIKHQLICADHDKPTNNKLKKILLDAYPAQGHVNAMIRLADEMIKFDYECVFVGYPFFKELVESSGHGYYDIDSFHLVPVGIEIKKKKWIQFLIENIQEHRNIRLKKQYDKSRLEYDSLIDKICPDIVFVDDHYSDKLLFYNKYNVLVVNVMTTVPPDFDRLVPCFSDETLPSPKFMAKVKMRLSWWLTYVERDFYRQANKFLCLGETNLKFLCERSYNKNITVEWNRCLGIGFKGFTNISTTFKQFDFQREITKKNVYYLGRTIDLNIRFSVMT